MTETRLVDLQPVSPRSLVDHVVDSLREGILDGVWSPGEKLVERTISSTLGASTIAVREAFVRLAEEGLVERVPRRGAFVARVTPEFVRDLSRVRIVLEQLAVELAIEHWNGDFERRGQKIVEEMTRAAYGPPPARRFWELDEEFHRLFLEAARSETLATVVANLRGRVARYMRQASMQLRPDELPETLRSHQDWLDAVAAHDLERARTIVHDHISAGCEDLIAGLPTEDDHRIP
jgi:DNA-binding GntR family transcriptional regulator